MVGQQPEVGLIADRGVRLVVIRIDTVFRRRAVRKRFLARTAEEIAAWRAGAGIRAR
jgi:hypothetical protein